MTRTTGTGLKPLAQQGDTVEVHSEQETFRGTLAVRTPDNERATLIVMRRKRDVWLTFDGAIKTTMTMTNPETTQLVGLLQAAQARNHE